MKKMTEYQCRIVEENLEIVDRVIRYKIKINGQALQTYEDFYQIGCEALCKAAMSYDPEQGHFYPLGSRYVFNAIIDHCRKQNRNRSIYADLVDENGDNDFLIDSVPVEDTADDIIYSQEVWVAFDKCKREVKMRVCKNCLRYFAVTRKASTEYCDRICDSRGRTCREMGAVNTWTQSKRGDEVFKEYRREYKKRFARINAGKLTKTAFYAWSEEARRRKADCDSGMITAGEFSRWLKESE